MGNSILYVIYLLFTGYVCAGTFDSRPKIYPDENEYIISSNDDFNITCMGMEEITWTYPNETINEYFWSSITVRTSKSEGRYPYHALLTITNASYVDTGFYYCHGMTANMDDERRSSKIYIYVYDKNHLSVLPSDEIQFKYAPEHSNATIPCRPTSPDVTVTLLDIHGSKVNPKYYDPKIGFTLIEIKLLEEGTYHCTFNNSDLEESLSIYLYVMSVHPFVQKPYIDPPNNVLTSVGHNLTLNCSISVEISVYFELTWHVPDETGLATGRITFSRATSTTIGSDKKGWSILTVTNVRPSDAGDYICKVQDHVNNTNEVRSSVTVLDKGKSRISLNDSGTNVITSEAGADNVKWVIKIDAYPDVELLWRNNRGEEIVPGTKNSKYSMERKAKTSVTLTIFQISLNDSGIYQLIAFNNIEQKNLNLTLIVKDKPAVEIVSQNYHKFGEKSFLQCIAAGYPQPTINWWFQACQDDSCSFKLISRSEYSVTTMGLQTIASINITANVTGLIRCIASNDLGNDSYTKGFYVTDVDEGFHIWGIDDPLSVAVGDDVKINCAVSIYNYTEDINWYIWKKNTRHIITPNDKYIIKRNTTTYTYQVSLKINSITLNDTGKYACVAKTQPPEEIEDIRNETIKVNNPLKPKIINSNMNGSELQVKAGQPLELHCIAEGYPVPNIEWRKDNKDWSIRTNHSHIKISEDNNVLSFKYLDDDDTGEYSCKAENRIGSDIRRMRLFLSSNSKVSVTLIVVIAILGITFLLLITILIVKIKKERKLRRELRIAGLQNFEKGALESLNPDLGVDDQAELLPYDKKWEFPRDKLKLGKQLGSGAFGVVMKAEAFGLVEGETVTIVAVKMVKRNADYTYIKALASELKIMVHLGKHLNVVNLLGACTKNVTKRELFVIVEYCRFGNLHNYLLRHRDDFINQIDPVTGSIDITIGAEYLNRTLSVGSNQSGARSPAFAGVDYRSTQNPNSCNTDSTAVCTPTGEDSLILSNNSVQPEWRSNYRGDYNKGNVKPISTHDLLCWAFQVARGMEYLASRKVLHGDLAARNILLAEDNIVKICDFGLAKSMYKSDNYKKKGDGPLPVKWMAVESIRDKVFSTQSDVWSYGIVLWEFFSLARTPYPGMDADERLYNKLVDGYRMDQPEYSTKEIYQIMMECWQAKPIYRPSFTKLAENLGCMLQESVRQHYIELNDPYILMNNAQMEGHSDYLAMLSPPDYGNLASPVHEYVNDSPFTEDSPAEASALGYLPMDIFSPKPIQSVFDFELHKKQKANGESATGPELLPILHGTSESDSELSPTSPISSDNCFANPNYQTATAVGDKTKCIEPKKDIVPSVDNYINMPQQKMALKNTDAFSNPSYIEMNNKKIIATENDNYVNSQSRDWERP